MSEPKEPRQWLAMTKAEYRSRYAAIVEVCNNELEFKTCVFNLNLEYLYGQGFGDIVLAITKEHRHADQT